MKRSNAKIGLQLQCLFSLISDKLMLRIILYRFSGKNIHNVMRQLNGFELLKLGPIS